MRAPGGDGEARAYKLASVLLQYPAPVLFDGLDALDAEAARCPGSGHFARFLRWLRAATPQEAAAHYVATFDLGRRCALYLSYHRHGDTRRRGVALLAYTSAYGAAGFTPPDHELPDHLPVVLEFAALSPHGAALLRRRQTELEVLRRALREAGTPYVHLLDAVCALLPRMRGARLAAVRRLWESGPPDERVGLEPYGEPAGGPFGPPEHITGREAQP